MTKFAHKLSISIYLILILISIGQLSYFGFSYYNLRIEERYFSPLDIILKPSGFIGHGLGIFGTLLIVVGLFGYMARKRLQIFSRIGALKYWLELHIFMTTLGTVFVLFHTSFKFGGLISVGFWCLAIIWISGVIGRFIYIQIPHTIQGRELSLHEIKDLKREYDLELADKYKIDILDFETKNNKELSLFLAKLNLTGLNFRKVKKLIRKQIVLERRIRNLNEMKRLFKYWHVFHLPFAVVMLIIMLIHVGVEIYFGYIWIF